MKYLLIVLSLLSISPIHAEEKNEMQDLFRVTCFNGKIGSDSKCSTTTQLNEKHAPDQLKGGITCGYPKLTSKIEWELKKKKGKNWTFLISRIFPFDQPNAEVTQKEITYSGERIIVFEDAHQVIVFEPIANQS